MVDSGIETLTSKRIPRSAAPLREQAVVVIRDLITTGEYGPNHRLTEASLCEMLGVSRTVVREALRQLETEHLIEIVPNFGPVVKGLTPAEAEHLYDVRMALESLAAAKAAENANEDDVKNLAEVVARLEGAGDVPLESMVELKDEFYDRLVEASRNNVIGDMLANIHARISLLRRLTLSEVDRRPAMLAELKAMLQAISDGDAERARSATAAHVMAAREVALRGLTEAQG